MSGYSPKKLYSKDDARNRLISGIEKIAGAVKSTLGPFGNTVIIESPEHLHGITVTKDGVTVAKSISLIDPVENIAATILKQAAERTASSSGDGTSTACVLTEALVLAGTKMIENGANRTETLRELKNLTDKAVEFIKSKSIDVPMEKIKDVATISANNDEELGAMIAQAYEEVGRDGIVTVDKSQKSETYFETTKGIKVDRGYYNPLFINSSEKDECIYEDVHILVADVTISNIFQLEKILAPIHQQGKKLLIISELTTNMIKALLRNRLSNDLQVCAIQPPSFGYRQHELMQDIALTVGATYFSEQTGDDLSHITMKDLGRASKVVVGQHSTLIVKSDEEENEEITQRVAELKKARELNTTTKDERSFIDSRIASLSGGIGVIYAGGRSDLEQKELYDRIDDAVCAVRSALEEGILPGGGLVLYSYSKMMESFLELPIQYADNEPEKVAAKIFAEALKAPVRTILENGDLKLEDIYTKDLKWGVGYNMKSGKMEDLVKSGVIDPTKVVRSALQNAVSVAITILSTNAIVTMAREIE